LGLVGYAYRQQLPLEAAIKYMLVVRYRIVIPSFYSVWRCYNAESGDLSLAGLGKSL
jgi:hypothetical protein